MPGATMSAAISPGEGTSLLKPASTGAQRRWMLLGLHNRTAWMWITVSVLFPFAVFAVGFGGTKHCATIICIFELVGLCTCSAFQISVGLLLDRRNFVSWFVLQLVVTTIGCVCNALYFY